MGVLALLTIFAVAVEKMPTHMREVALVTKVAGLTIATGPLLFLSRNTLWTQSKCRRHFAKQRRKYYKKMHSNLINFS